MDEKTAFRHELISAWCGPAFLISFIIFWVIIGQNFPNPSPALTAEALQARYAENLGSIRLGFIMSMIIVVFYLPWTALLSTQMARVEGRFPVMAYLQLLGGGLTVMVVSFSAFFWVAAAFRPDQDPATTQMLTDLGWLCIDLQYACTTLQMIAAALVGLADKREVPLFPRWACYVTIWCGLSFLPASLTGVVKTGPFAWDGMLSYYIPYACWLGWYTIASTYMIKEVHRRIKASEDTALANPSLSRA
ncbi:MAG: hypothetical protein ACI8RU_001446 [Zhongshania aliphaticivorans]|jgi:hypothetical protein|uniref:hypothetical protein n=1 Tax=Zhongshania aliphaticivorans TaxID=1470434 RepID=UPI0039E50936